jgi:hypothetical protein
MKKSVNSLVLREEKAMGGIVGKVCIFLRHFIVLPPDLLLVVSAWVMAAWLMDIWDRFPHLAITSPEKRCGKTRLLALLELLVPNPCSTCNITLAALCRVVELERATILYDEAPLGQGVAGFTNGMRDLLNAGIDRNATVRRADSGGGVRKYSIYSPKVIALVGKLDSILADRCLPVDLERKTNADFVERYYSQFVEPIGKALHDELEKWATSNANQVAEVYRDILPFPINNDRMAELLMPLQAVLQVAAPELLEILESYAVGLDEREGDTMSPGVELLVACREILTENRTVMATGFVPTKMLLKSLLQRDWEPWCHWKGREMTTHALCNLLRPFSIRSDRNRQQTMRGFFVQDFQKAWDRYLPPLPPEEASEASNPSAKKRRKPR